MASPSQVPTMVAKPGWQETSIEITQPERLSSSKSLRGLQRYNEDMALTDLSPGRYRQEERRRDILIGDPNTTPARRILPKLPHPAWRAKDLEYKDDHFATIKWPQYYDNENPTVHPSLPPTLLQETGNIMREHLKRSREDSVALVFRMYNKPTAEIRTSSHHSFSLPTISM
ncbi:hypothetical protein O1611_g9132 [Lasiodiplodia mahajangana]|uniref:Uncharacterized protein n=1 Tax=Lasiodiplodia mahajangana TaxID=1108764 RepID=A0ACC2JAX5_9PEZI|nr:hypothetical protein O1611_g9132 [Lasiodiplodia mahajangana]